MTALDLQIDSVSLVKCVLKLEKWNGIKSGKYKSNDTENPDERIAYWETEKQKNLERLKAHGFAAFPEIMNIVGLFAPVFPFIFDEIKKIFNITF